MRALSFGLSGATLIFCFIQISHALENNVDPGLRDYLGCYSSADLGIAGFAQIVNNPDGVDQSYCADVCTTSRYSFSAITEGTTCLCSSTAVEGSLYEQQCSIPCSSPDHSTENCGGTGYAVVYGLPLPFQPPPSLDPPLGASYLACFHNNPVVLSSSVATIVLATHESCRDKCIDFRYFGLADGNMCYCGNYLRPGAEQVPGQECSTPAAGDSSQAGGGNGLIATYRNEYYASTVALTFERSTALKAGTTTTFFVSSPNSAGIEFVYTFSDSDIASGTHIATLSGGADGVDGFSLPFTIPAQSLGYYSLTVQSAEGDYAAAGYIVVTANTDFPPNQHLGCFSNGPAAILTPTGSPSDLLTYADCANTCGNVNLFGLQQQQCFCGNALQGTASQVSDDDCNATCGGDSGQICGDTENTLITVFANAGFSLSPSIVFNPASPLPGTQATFTISSVDSTDVVFLYRFTPAITSGQVTSTANGGAGGSPGASVTFTVPTTAVGTYTLTATDDQGRFRTSSSFTILPPSTSFPPNTFAGCYRNNPVQSLSATGASSDSLTYSDCAATCGNVKYFGLQSRQCFCGNTFLNAQTVNEGECTAPCSGNASQICGNGDNTLLTAFLNAAFSLSISITFSPPSLLPGSDLTFTVSSAESTGIIFTYAFDRGLDGSSTATSTANGGAGGLPGFSRTVTIPTTATGTYTLTITAEEGRFSTSKSFSVVSLITSFPPHTYRGCFGNNPALLSGAPLVDALITPQKCQQTCVKFQYFGLAGGNTCYCGNSFQNDAQFSASGCNIPAAGNNSFAGGGDGYITTWQNVEFLLDATVTFVPLGPYVVGSNVTFYVTSPNSAETRISYSFSNNNIPAGSLVSTPGGGGNGVDGISKQFTIPSDTPAGASSLTVIGPSGSFFKTVDYNVIATNFLPNQYLGCYSNSPAAILTPTGSPSASLTYSDCANACGNVNLFGLQQQQCFCGNAFQGTATQAADVDCNAACSGNSGQVCGNTDNTLITVFRNAAFSLSPSLVFTPASPLPGSQITFTITSTDSAGITFFYAFNKDIAGGQVISTSTGGANGASGATVTLTIPSTASGTYTLTVNDNQNRFSTSESFTVRALSTGPPNGATYLACFNNNPILLSSSVATIDLATQENCLDECIDFRYFGLAEGNLCYCGNSLRSGATRVTDPECSTPAAGDSSQAGGGNGLITTYKNSYASTVAITFEPATALKVGTTAKFFVSSPNSAGIEFTYTFSDSDIASGTHVATQSGGADGVDGFSLPFTIPAQSLGYYSLTVQSAEGDYAAVGYIVVTANTDFRPNKYLGCFSNGPAAILTPTGSPSDSLTYADCANTCGNVNLFGLQQQQCFCGNALQGTVSQVSDDDCNATCGGDSGQICGDTENTLITVFANAGFSLSPSLVFDPASPLPGTQATFTITSVDSTDVVFLYRFSQAIPSGQVTSTANGGAGGSPGASVTFTVPTTASGTYTLRITDEQGRFQTTRSFTIIPPSNSFPPNTFVGCYTNSPIQSLSATGAPSDSLTYSDCAATCGNVKYFGLQSRQCFCGYSFVSRQTVIDSDCTAPCSGNISQFCGNGDNTLLTAFLNAAFSLSISITLTRPTSSLLTFTVSSADSTGIDFTYAFDRGLDRSRTATSTANGGAGGLPGFSGSLTIPTTASGTYTLTVTAEEGRFSASESISILGTNFPPHIYQGCFVNNPTLLSGAPTVDALATPQKCQQTCVNFLYFGLAGGDTCYCGNAFQSDAQSLASGCNIPAGGDSSFAAGDDGSITTWQNSEFTLGSVVTFVPSGPYPAGSIVTFYVSSPNSADIEIVYTFSDTSIPSGRTVSTAGGGANGVEGISHQFTIPAGTDPGPYTLTVSDASGALSNSEEYAVIMAASQGGNRRRFRRKRVASLCPQPGDSVCFSKSGHNFECANLESDLVHCGGCNMDGLPPQGENCLEIPHAITVSCINRRCHVGSCEAPYRVSADNSHCRQSRRKR